MQDPKASSQIVKRKKDFNVKGRPHFYKHCLFQVTDAKHTWKWGFLKSNVKKQTGAYFGNINLIRDKEQQKTKRFRGGDNK